jgi:predicted oxidoreductase
MTTSATINGGAIIVWPEATAPDELQFEHAIAVVPYSGSISIEQNGNTITVPLYAISDLLRAMRKVIVAAKEKS